MKKRMISILLSMVLFLANVPAVNAADKAVAPSKPIVTLSVPTLISGEYHVGDSVYPEWDWGDNVTHYNSYWEKKNNLG